MAQTVDPIGDFYRALSASERLKSVRVLLGARQLPTPGAPPRIVLVPMGGQFTSPEDKDNQTDLPLVMRCHCWGGGIDTSQLWSILCSLILAVQDYRLSTDVDAQYLRVDFEDEPDTDREGFAATVNIVLRLGIEFVPLAADANTATIDNLQFTRG